MARDITYDMTRLSKMLDNLVFVQEPAIPNGWTTGCPADNPDFRALANICIRKPSTNPEYQVVAHGAVDMRYILVTADSADGARDECRKRLLRWSQAAPA